MGLNWAAALDRVQEGVGKIASFKYDQFLRNDEKQRQDKMAEIAYQRQMNMARFQLQGQKEIAGQSQEFQAEQGRLSREQQADQFGQTIGLQREQLRGQAADRAAAAAERKANAEYRNQQMQMLKDEWETKKQDRDTAKKLGPLEDIAKSAALQLDSSAKMLKELGMNGTPQERSDLLVQQQRASQLLSRANAGKMALMYPTMSLSDEQRANIDKTMADNPGISLQAAILDTLAPSIAPPDEEKTAPPKVEKSAFWDTVAGGSTGAKLRFPDGSEQPMPGQDFEPSLFHMIGEPVRALGGIEITNGASMAAGDALLQETPAQADADPLAGRNARASIAVAMKKLEVPTQKELAAWDGKSSLSDNAMKDIQVKGYDPNTFMSYLRH